MYSMNIINIKIAQTLHPVKLATLARVLFEIESEI